MADLFPTPHRKSLLREQLTPGGVYLDADGHAYVRATARRVDATAAEFEAAGWATRVPDAGHPGRESYELTDAGRAPIADDIRARIAWLLAELAACGVAWDVVLPDGTHRYRCTGGRHGVDGHCGSSVRLDGGPKEPMRCKWCEARCEIHGGGDG